MRLGNLHKTISADRLLTATVLSADVLRSYPWLVFSSGLSVRLWVEPPLSFISALAIICGAAVLFGRGLAPRFHTIGARVAVFFLSTLAILLLTRLENGGGYALWDSNWFGYASQKPLQLIAGLGFSLFLVWRGITISRKDLDVKYLRSNLAIGTGAFVALTLVWSVRSGPLAGQRLFATLAPYALGYLFFALFALGIGNFLTLRKSLNVKSVSDRFSRRWLLLLLGAVAGMVIATLLISSGVSLNLTLLLRPLSTMAGWLTQGFIYIVLYPFGYVLIGVEWLGKAVVNWLAGLPGPKRFLSLEGLRDFANNANIKSGQPPDQLFSIIKWIILVIVVALAVYFLWRLLRRYWKGNQEKGYEVIQESIWSWSGIQGDIRSLLKGLGGRPHRSRRHASAPAGIHDHRTETTRYS